ncbi:MAG: hypothetical protein IKP67_01340, partial [Spirochaetales bacterium]|nr:hypothetical protein [Spirochaetales bacterium]
TDDMQTPAEEEYADMTEEEPLISDDDYAEIESEPVTAEPARADDEPADMTEEEPLISDDDYAEIESEEETKEPTEAGEETADTNDEEPLISDDDFADVESEDETEDVEDVYEEEEVEVEVTEEEPAEEFDWVTSLEPNKIYVRFMTIYDRAEAQRMARNFKSIIGRVTVYKTDDKFILLCGPYNSDSDEAFTALSDLKSMGFSDAYLLSE